MHTQSSNTVNVSGNPIRIHNPVADMDVHVLHPDFAAVTASTEPFDNQSQDPNSTILKLLHSAVNPRFSLLLFPSNAAIISPAVSRENLLWGFACRLEWGGGLVDVVLGNHTGGTVTWGADSVQTDASLAVVRTTGSVVARHLIVDATQLRHLGVEYVRIFDGPVTCALEDGVIHLDRDDAAFRIRDTGIDRVVCRDADVPFVRHNGYLYNDDLVAVTDRVVPPQTLEVAVFPNPFNPTVTVRIDVSKAAHLRAAVYDAAGREVNTLSDRSVGAGRVTLRWEGTNGHGRPVPSGVYFLKVTADGLTRTKKLTVIK
ncbi:MAG: T9SS type A sorting domain-containing protein [Candidatus Krumholzibacteria bacterium]|nr:T9SS type A sorting domain-containing protein [Candidatus Krumholzibacteria bacterium]